MSRCFSFSLNAAGVRKVNPLLFVLCSTLQKMYVPPNVLLLKVAHSLLKMTIVEHSRKGVQVLQE